MTDLRYPLRMPSSGILNKPDFIINCASSADVTESLKEPVKHIQNNIATTLTMLEYAREQGCKRFVQVSTGEVYGPLTAHCPNPAKEWQYFLPYSPYAGSKAAQEMLALAYCNSYRIPLIITNTQNIFGENQAWNKFIPSLVKKIYQGETVELHGSRDEPLTRKWLHARSHAAAILTLLNQNWKMRTGYESETPRLRCNITGDTTLTHLELAQKIRKILGKKLKYKFTGHKSLRPGHQGIYSLDGSWMKNYWTPRDFDYDLKSTVEYYVAKLEAQR